MNKTDYEDKIDALTSQTIEESTMSGEEKMF